LTHGDDKNRDRARLAVIYFYFSFAGVTRHEGTVPEIVLGREQRNRQEETETTITIVSDLERFRRRKTDVLDPRALRGTLYLNALERAKPFLQRARVRCVYAVWPHDRRPTDVARKITRRYEYRLHVVDTVVSK